MSCNTRIAGNGDIQHFLAKLKSQNVSSTTDLTKQNITDNLLDVARLISRLTC